MKGTLIKAPPAPTRPDKNPMISPAANRPISPGTWREAAGFLSINIWVAEKLTKAAKDSASQAPCRTANTATLANAPPNRMPGLSPLTRSQRTLPRLWWARTLEIEVKSMVAMEVAMAILTAKLSPTPRWVNATVMKGTMIMPPPMPSRPARKPVASPSRASSTISKGSSMGVAERVAGLRPC